MQQHEAGPQQRHGDGRSGWRRWSWVGFLALTALVSALGSLVSAGDSAFYRQLEKPWFTPPGAVFGPVWISLYVLMAVSAHRVFVSRPSMARRRALLFWGAQLLVNGMWSPLFFGLETPRWALADILVLVPLVVFYIVYARRVDRLAAWLMAPYLAWAAFATVLNFTIVRLNPGT